jgi:hypothetical protein
MLSFKKISLFLIPIFASALVHGAAKVTSVDDKNNKQIAFSESSGGGISWWSVRSNDAFGTR